MSIPTQPHSHTSHLDYVPNVFQMSVETLLALILEVANVKDSITISHKYIDKKSAPIYSFLLHLPLAFQQLMLDNLAPTAPSAQDVSMDTTDVTSDSNKQANLNTTTQSITSTPPEAIAADTTCISAMPCLLETNIVSGVSVVADACLTHIDTPIDRSPLVTSTESAIESSATDPVESASVIETEMCTDVM